MEELLKITLIGLFFGTFGTTIGGIIGVTIKTTSEKFLSFILEFASGLMIAIVCFGLIPESLKLSEITITAIGILLGIIVMILCNIFVKKKLAKRPGTRNSLLKTGIIVSIGLAIHNFPEGLAIGSGFGSSITLGYSLAVAILLHDVPEGIAMSVPMKSGGMKKSRVLIYTILSGATTGVGAFFGSLIGNVSEGMISMCLAFAGGAMLYIVFRRINAGI